MNILLLGGTGRTGSRVHAELVARHLSVPVAVRAPTSTELDLTHMTTPESWLPWLKDVDVVVHVAGVMREDGADTFAAHLTAARTLALAAICGKLRHLVCLSSAGAREDSAVPWFAFRGAADGFLDLLDLPTTIVRCGLLYQEGVGGTRRSHPHAPTLDWQGATGGLPLTRLFDAVATIAQAALGEPPRGHRVLDLAEATLARAA